MRKKRLGQAILEAIMTAVTQDHPGARVAEMLKIAHTAVHSAYTGKKHGVIGKHKLLGPDTTIADILKSLPVYLWPPAGGNGCFRISCAAHDLVQGSH
jgi:ATP-dependent RNA circularization protein (DNA/RNA ligase family)